MITQKLDITWTNTIGTCQAIPALYAEPESLEDIRAVILEAEQKGKQVRAVGSGHSFNDVAITNDYMLYPGKLDKVVLTDKKILTPHWQNYLNHVNGVNPGRYTFADVQAGIRIRDLNKILDFMGLALFNMGGIDHQTISGAVSTGTHGSGKDLPAITGFVRSITLVAAGANVYRIEPANGITDPAAFQEKDVTLIQNDDTFNSVLLSFGSMGVIYSMVLEVRPAYWMEEVKTLMKWSTLKYELLSGSIFNDFYDDKYKTARTVRGVIIQINPYAVSGDHSCIVVRHMELNRTTNHNLFDRTRNIMSFLVGNVFSKIAYRINMNALKTHPEKTPKTLESALRSIQDKRYLSKSYKVLLQGFYYVKERAYDCEFAFDMRTRRPVEAIEGIIRKANEMKESKGYYQSCPISVRFVRASTALLAPEHEKDMCFIDTPFLLHTNGSDEMLTEYQKVQLAHGGIPHWGKINTCLDGRIDLIQAFYPRLSVWQDTLNRFNPRGTFDNAFVSRLGLRKGRD